MWSFSKFIFLMGQCFLLKSVSAPNPSGIQLGHLRLKHLLQNHWAAEAVAQLKSFHRIRRRTAETSAEQKILVLFYFSTAFSKLPNDTSQEAAAAVDRADGLLARLQAVTCLRPHSPPQDRFG